MVLGIYGAGGLGREVYELAVLVNRENNRWSEIIFIDDSDDIDSSRNLTVCKYAKAKNLYSKGKIEFCIAIGEPFVRKEIFDRLSREGMKFTKLIHPDIDIPKSTSIGDGVIICKYVSITCDISIGENVYIHPMVCIGHDAVISDNSVISSFVDVPGNCKIGSCVYLGLNVILKQGVKVGDSTIVGMGSVVYNDITDEVIALGNPARPMKKNEEKRVFGK